VLHEEDAVIEGEFAVRTCDVDAHMHDVPVFDEKLHAVYP
jgi:hypothetical protein